MPEVLAPLLLYALLFLALAMAFSIKKVNQAVFGLLIAAFGAIPGVAGVLRSAENHVATAINGAFGAIYNGLDKGIGWSNHLLAEAWDELWKEVRKHSELIAAVTNPIAAIVYAVHALKRAVNALHNSHTSISHDVKKLTREWHGIEHRVGKLEKDWTKGIGHDLITHVAGLTKAWDAFRTGELQTLEHDVARIPSDAIATERWVAKNFPAIGTKTLTTAVAVALGALGLSGLTCRNFKNLLSKWGCGLGGLLDALLGLAISALALENVCSLLPIAETAFGEVVGPVTHLLTEVPLGGCETPPKSWAKLSVATGPLPPPQTLGTLAA